MPNVWKYYFKARVNLGIWQARKQENLTPYDNDDLSEHLRRAGAKYVIFAPALHRVFKRQLCKSGQPNR
jgi:hypothetical protein